MKQKAGLNVVYWIYALKLLWNKSKYFLQNCGKLPTWMFTLIWKFLVKSLLPEKFDVAMKRSETTWSDEDTVSRILINLPLTLSAFITKYIQISWYRLDIGGWRTYIWAVRPYVGYQLRVTGTNDLYQSNIKWEMHEKLRKTRVTDT